MQKFEREDRVGPESEGLRKISDPKGNETPSPISGLATRNPPWTAVTFSHGFALVTSLVRKASTVSGHSSSGCCRSTRSLAATFKGWDDGYSITSYRSSRGCSTATSMSQCTAMG